ncbi:calmodulin-binding protein 60 E isoform X2 [Populus trichocarpa]|uniref:calmodulin-binding protein 60 E isoform X2 n=1 Tax=Populus trichocarpa TaxID=3694 RepID=UPI000D188E58|nr:calmodulin-binding protein 60 E isoform X2 [Populus trichocarpa]|eukprot:XP_024446178.1 calmodulin-binding protein 60 E isoform X2 [Populus trichocarpa]
MESSRGRRVEKRGYEQGVDDEADNLPESKKAKLPALARSSPPKLPGPNGNDLQLHFRTRMPPHLFTGGKVEGEQGATIHVVLLDASTGTVMQTGPESAAKLNVVVLEGDFNDEADEGWTAEHFESHEVKEREGKRPLLTGDLQVSLKEGVGTLGDLTFTDNSSWIRSRKFRLGVKVSPGYCEGIRVREAKTEAFAVKDHRGELYKKHYPPALQDEVWRLDRIAKDGALHKKLVMADITTVEDFLRVLFRDSQKLRNILGSGMSNRMWENTVEHAKTCVLGGKLYVYYAAGTHSTGVVFNNVYEPRGLISDGQFLSLDSLNHNQKISVDSLVKRAYENWHHVVEYDGKVLNSLASNKGGKGASAAPIVDNSYERNQYITSDQNKQQFIPSEPSPQYQAIINHPSVPQLIKFPFVRSDQNAAMTLNNPQAALSGGTDYMSVGTPAGDTYFPGDWSRPRTGNGLEDFFTEEIRVRSSEMLESDDMQRLLKTLGMGGVGMGPGFVQPDEPCYSYSVQAYEPQMDQTYAQERGKGSKAVVGWLKLKAALRWGIFVRKKAAERRAQLVELD